MAEEKRNGVKWFLEQVKLCDTHINNKLAELSSLKDMVTHITASLGGEVVSGGSNQDKLGDAIAKIIDLENEINNAVDAYIDKKKQVGAVLDKLTDPDQIKVLHKRYFEDKTWEEIACEMHMTYRNVCYIHGRALQAVSEILKGAE